MDTIEFVIAPDTISDAFKEECIEPVINGTSLVDRVKRAERRPIAWVGLTPDDLLGRLQGSLKVSRQIGDRVAVLRCVCGHRDCSDITVEVATAHCAVNWAAFKAPGQSPEPYTSIGAFEFSGAEYRRAVEHPRRADAPIRDHTVLDALARGEPTVAREWLQLAYMEADWPAESEALPGLLAGLRARSGAGNPISENEAYRWAREMGWHEGTSGTIVGLVRAANSP